MFEKYDAIIFDFDGVIVDSFNIKNNAFREIYKCYGLEDRVDVREGGRSRFEKFTYFHKKLLGRTIKEEELKSLCDTFSNMVFDAIVNADLIVGVKKFIENNYQTKKLYVVSGTPTMELKKLLSAKELIEYFDGVFGPDREKSEYLRNIAKDFDNVVYIGDQMSDYDAAKKAGVDFIGVTNEKIFPKHVRVHSFNELL